MDVSRAVEMEDDRHHKQQVNNPHIKKVLKTYQLSAPRSLQGPNSVLDEPAGAAVAVCSPKAPMNAAGGGGGGPGAGAGAANGGAGGAGGCDADAAGRKTPAVAAPSLPLHPVLYVPDQSGCELFETELEWEKIACFMVGGEMRLCLPQILNTVLRDFTLTQINQVCDELRIYCSRCTPEQLDVLKHCQILPATAPSCGLMTKTNAERLCFALLHRVPPPAAQVPEDVVTFSFEVFHDVFGKTRGVCMPELYTEKFSACIQCVECKALFAPQRFVNHIHRFTGTNSCHWGYKRENWKAYIKVSHGHPDYAEVVNLFETFKEQIEESSTTHFSSRKRKQVRRAFALGDMIIIIMSSCRVYVHEQYKIFTYAAVRAFCISKTSAPLGGSRVRNRVASQQNGSRFCREGPQLFHRCVCVCVGGRFIHYTLSAVLSLRMIRMNAR